MTFEEAECIFNESQDLIKYLNQSLVNLKSEVKDESDFQDIRIKIAMSMANIVDLLEEKVYLEYPELRPYSI